MMKIKMWKPEVETLPREELEKRQLRILQETDEVCRREKSLLQEEI